MHNFPPKITDIDDLDAAGKRKKLHICYYCRIGFHGGELHLFFHHVSWQCANILRLLSSAFLCLNAGRILGFRTILFHDSKGIVIKVTGEIKPRVVPCSVMLRLAVSAVEFICINTLLLPDLKTRGHEDHTTRNTVPINSQLSLL